MIQDICPCCEKITNITSIKKRSNVSVKCFTVEIDDEYLHCMACGNDFDEPKSNYDILEVVYQKIKALR